MESSRNQLYVDDNPLLCLNVVCMAALAVFLFANGNNFAGIALIILVWAAILAGYLFCSWFARKVQIEKILELTEQLGERYLISEVMEKPGRADDQIYYQVLKLAGKIGIFSLFNAVAFVLSVIRRRNKWKNRNINGVFGLSNALRRNGKQHISLY